jgi:hypothetical protein
MVGEKAALSLLRNSSLRLSTPLSTIWFENP